MTDNSEPKHGWKDDARLYRILPASGTLRTLAIAQTMTAIAGGIYFSSSTLFFTRVSGLMPLEIALGLTLSGLVGLLVPLPFGMLADHWNVRNIIVWLTAGIGVNCWIFLTINGFYTFVVTACCFMACLRGAMTARMAMIATLVDQSQRTRTSAYLRALGNCGLSIGAMIGGLALYFDSPGAYKLTFAVGGAIFLLAAMVYRSLPSGGKLLHSDRAGRSPIVLKDRHFIGLTLLNTIILLYIPLLNMALPLWIAFHTRVPLWIAPVLYAINTAGVMLFRLRFAKRITSASDARRSIVFATFLLSAACLAFAAMATAITPWLAVMVAILGAVLHVLGETKHMAGAWDMSFRLAPPGRQGEYQGFFNTSPAAAEMLGPVLFVALLIDWGIPGWILMALVFPLAGLAIFKLFERWPVCEA